MHTYTTVMQRHKHTNLYVLVCRVCIHAIRNRLLSSQAHDSHPTVCAAKCQIHQRSGPHFLIYVRVCVCRSVYVHVCMCLHFRDFLGYLALTARVH